MNKIGLHIIGGWPGSLGRPRLVKLLDVSPEYVGQVRLAIGPDALIIIRWYQPSQPLDQPAARAQQFVARYQSQMLAMRQVAGEALVFEAYNEVPDSLANAYASFEAERLRIMHGLGLRSVVGCFSVGTPDLPVWATYGPMLAAMQPGDFLGLHEYWPDTAGIDNRWWCGRWTKVPALTGVPIVVTECGRDVVEGRGQPGWRRSCDAPAFLEDLRHYNVLLEQFPQLLGGAVFSTPGPAGGWADFDPTPIWPEVVASYSAPQTYPGASVPTSPQPPQEERMEYTTNVSAPGVRYRDWYGTQQHSSRYGRPITHIVLHDPEAPPTNGLQATLSTITNEPRSYHDVVDETGQVWRCVPYDRAAWHCGGSHIDGIPDGSYGGTSETNLRSIGVSMVNPADAISWPAAQLAATILHVRELCRVHKLAPTAVIIRRHCDINPKKLDPRGVDWLWFLAQVAADGPVGLSTGWPHDEPAIEPGSLQDKIRWWTEQAVREIEAGYNERGHAILRDLLNRETGLMYRLERMLKGTR